MTTNQFTGLQASVLQHHLFKCPHRQCSVQAALDQVHQWRAHPFAYCVTLAHDDYPAVLRSLSDAPPVLYGLGHWQTLGKPAVAIVGARRCNRRAAEHAYRLARDIASKGWCVVSGLAAGIDTAAHRGALAAGVAGSTIAVFGNGIDIAYPSHNAPLAQEIVDAGGLLLSEFALGTPPLAAHFPQRNRIVAALSRAAIVVQARARSGSMITARLAAEMGREVLAVPGLPGEALSEGPHTLIRQGAALIEHADDLWSAFGLCAQMNASTLSLKPDVTRKNHRA